MQLSICVFLAIVFCTDGLLSKCPVDRPSMTSPKCSTDADCQNGYSCCTFNAGKYCSSTDSEKCDLNGRTIWRGETVLHEDKCTECSCLGYDHVVCTSETCGWQVPKKLQAMSMAKCPVLKPEFSYETCNDSLDCRRDQHCCKYPTGDVCVAKNENVCTYGNKIIKTGDIITLDDNCTFCECAGFENMLCIDDDCFWNQEEEIREKTPFCPMKRLESEVTKCQYQSDCPEDHNCCRFEDGKYCVSDRNNVCHFNGQKLMKLEVVRMHDQCTVCECRGYDIIMCKDTCKNGKSTKR